LATGKVLVTGGYSNGATLASSQLYTPSSNSWQNATGMTTQRRNHAATLLSDGRVLVTGGQNTQALATAAFYDPPTNSWTYTGDMILARYNHAAVLLNSGNVLVVG